MSDAPRPDVTLAINEAARRLTSAAPDAALRARVLAEISRTPRVWRPWRLVLAGGSIAAAALVATLAWPRVPPDLQTITAPEASLPAATAPAVGPALASLPTVEPLTAYLAPPTVVEVVRVAAPDTSAESTTVASAAWEAGRATALRMPDPLRVDALQPSPLSIDTIDITPLSVLPLIVPAMGGGR